MFNAFYATMIDKGRWLLMAKGLGCTLLIAFCAIIIGTILGFIFALMKISDKKVLLFSFATFNKYSSKEKPRFEIIDI